VVKNSPKWWFFASPAQTAAPIRPILSPLHSTLQSASFCPHHLGQKLVTILGAPKEIVKFFFPSVLGVIFGIYARFPIEWWYRRFSIFKFQFQGFGALTPIPIVRFQRNQRHSLALIERYQIDIRLDEIGQFLLLPAFTKRQNGHFWSKSAKTL
jgi:hypothetical protein